MNSPVADPELAPHWETAALVLIDVQRDFLSESPYGVTGTTEVLPRLRELAAAFRAAARPIVHVIRLYAPDGSDADRARRTAIAGGAQIVAPGSSGREIAPGLLPDEAPDLDDARLLAGHAQLVGPGEHVLYKPRWGAFYRTPLEDLLAGYGIDTIVVAGCNLPNCPRATLIEASERDYRIALATDAISQATDQGFRELAGIGTVLLPTGTIHRGLQGNRHLT